MFLPVGPTKVTQLKFLKAKTGLGKKAVQTKKIVKPTTKYYAKNDRESDSEQSQLNGHEMEPGTQHLRPAHKRQGFFQTNSAEWDIVKHPIIRFNENE